MIQSLIIRANKTEKDQARIREALRRLWLWIKSRLQVRSLDQDGALVALQFLISRHFNDEELRQLCFAMNVEYSELPGIGSDGKARELVLYCNRHNRLGELFRRVKAARPSAPWDYAASLDTGKLRSLE